MAGKATRVLRFLRSTVTKTSMIGGNGFYLQTREGTFCDDPDIWGLEN